MVHSYEVPLSDLFSLLLPEMALVAFACALFIGGLYRSDRKLWGSVAAAGLALAFVLHLVICFGPDSFSTAMTLNRQSAFGVPVLFDSLAMLTRVLALAAGAVFLLLCWDEVPEKQVADHHACFLIIVAGVSLVGSANDLITMFLALELISIPTYILLYLPRHDDPAQEASIKYFLLSIFSSALLLFGFSYLFGLAGTTNLSGILQAFYGAGSDKTTEISAMAQIAMLAVIAGLGFRITAVPFHFYAPDVFQGTSASGAAFLSYFPKIAGFVAIVRVFGFVVPAAVSMGDRPLVGIAISDQAPTLFWFLAALSMTVGNFLALLQDNLKRLLAYSSIAHAGYMLVALASASYLSVGDAPTSGVASLLYYLIAYGAMTFGIFAVILMLHRPDRPVETVDDLAGLAQSHPRIALMVAILCLSLIGIPLTAGFTGKLMIFFGAMTVESTTAPWLYPTLAVIGMLNAAVGAWYYLRIIAVMYLRTTVKPIQTCGPVTGLVVLVVCAVLTVIMSVPPGSNLVLNAVRQTTQRTATPLQNAGR